jgi:hypothetical protein
MAGESVSHADRPEDQTSLSFMVRGVHFLAGKRTSRLLIFPFNEFRYSPGSGHRRLQGAEGR